MILSTHLSGLSDIFNYLIIELADISDVFNYSIIHLSDGSDGSDICNYLIIQPSNIGSRSNDLIFIWLPFLVFLTLLSI